MIYEYDIQLPCACYTLDVVAMDFGSSVGLQRNGDSDIHPVLEDSRSVTMEQCIIFYSFFSDALDRAVSLTTPKAFIYASNFDHYQAVALVRYHRRRVTPELIMSMGLARAIRHRALIRKHLQPLFQYDERIRFHLKFGAHYDA